jgi:Tfp pilus assembly protein PilF
MSLIGSLLFKFLQKLNVPVKLALVSALIYCVHPLFVSSVAWIPSRGDLLLTVFSLAAFLSLMKFLTNGSLVALIAHLSFFILALFCKETAAALPILFGFYFVVFYKGDKRKVVHYAALAVYALSIAGWFVMRSKAIGSNTSSNDLVGLSALGANLRVIPEALAQLIFPLGLEEFPTFSITKTSIGVLALAAMIIVFIKGKQGTKRELLFGATWFLVLTIPALFFKNTQIDYLNHRFILPLVGVLIFIVFALPRKLRETVTLKTQMIFAFIALVLVIMSFSRMPHYADPVKFYTAATSDDSRSPLAFYNMGNTMKNITFNYTAAIQNYSKAIELKADYPEAYNNRGNAYVLQRSYEIAIRDFTRAIELKPDYADAYYDRGIAYKNAGIYDKAIADYTRTIELDPGYYKAYNNRGFVYFTLEDFNKAIADYTKAVELNPSYARGFYNRANAYIRKGDNEKACQDFEKAGQLGAQEAYESMDKYCQK